MYANCQEGAFAVGEFIESIKGEGTQTVVLLEEYCDLLFKASNGELGEKVLKNQLKKIENSVRNELKPTRIEMVFLCYKASMGDSLESIYIKAETDPDCDAYWMPVPYFDRNPDGSLGAMHYEGADCYNDRIECTDWREYDIEARHPDVVFTFNPYDAANYVTAVHPDYYCERLRDLADMLVYIPYFVSVEDVPEHFVTTAGCVYAHRVFVQSKSERDAYIRIYKKVFGDRFGKPEDKFVALGSPKFDKVITSRREDFILPSEWIRLIGGRKIVFLNTSVGTILTAGEQYLKKLRDTLETFKKRGDVVLWWRPHPLNEATYQAMRPQLLREYEQIAAEYKREGWGIFDDDSDLHRALAWSDAYYGDSSSIISLFGITGKPIMVGNTNVIRERKDYGALLFEHICDVDDFFWFTAFDYNALFKMNKSSWIAEYVGSFPDEVMIRDRLFSSIAMNNDKLYFSPLSAERITIFDMKNGTFHMIPFDEPPTYTSGNYNKGAKFISVVSYKSWLFFIGCSYPAIIRMNASTGELDYFSDWINKITRYVTHPDDPYWAMGFCVIENHLFLTSLCANVIMDFDMDTCSSKIHQVGSKGNCYSAICYDGKEFWLSPKNDTPVVSWNPENNHFVEHNITLDDYVGCDSSFWTICSTNNKIWLFPFYSNKAICIDKDVESRVVAAEAFQEAYSVKTNYSPKTGLGSYIMAKAIGDVIYAHTGRDNKFIAFNTANNERREEHIMLSEEQSIQLNQLGSLSYLEKAKYCGTHLDCIFNETPLTDLESYLDYVVNMSKSMENDSLSCKQMELFKNTIINADGTAGEAIFNYAKKLMLG